MKVMITGGSGRLGKELVKVFPNALTPSHTELNITNKNVVFAYVKTFKPNIVIHLAAIANIRKCEENKELCWKTNVQGTENLVKAALEYNVDYFVYISTACVFYGDKGDYVETDIPYTKNFYSLTKLLGEFIVKYSGLKKWLVIRTNFVPREKWPYPKAFVDRYGTYLFADDLSLAIKSIVSQNLTGIIHACGEDKISMFELAKMTTLNVKPMTMAEYKGPPPTVDMSLRSVRIASFKLTKPQSKTSLKAQKLKNQHKSC